MLNANSLQISREGIRQFQLHRILRCRCALITINLVDFVEEFMSAKKQRACPLFNKYHINVRQLNCSVYLYNSCTHRCALVTVATYYNALAP